MVQTPKLQGTSLPNQQKMRRQLPEDILYEILLRLPVKSLLRFRRVSKSWFSIIGEPAFKKNHADHPARLYPLLLVATNVNNGANAVFATYNNDWSLLHKCSTVIPNSVPDDGEDSDDGEDPDDGEDSDDREDPDDGEDSDDREDSDDGEDPDDGEDSDDREDPDDGEDSDDGEYDNEKMNFQLIQHCEGWICFRLLSGGSLHLCNPSTEELHHLPLEKVEKKGTSQEDDVCVGFGYAVSTKVFKVVRFWQLDYDSEECSCTVFTLGRRDGWRDVVKPPYFPSKVATATLLQGCLHLLPDCDAPENTDTDHSIAVFDLATERYKKNIRLPAEYFSAMDDLEDNKSKVPFQLAELGGSLFLAIEVVATRVHTLHLMFLEDYPGGQTWKCKCIVDLSSLVFEPLSYNWTIPIAVTGDGSILLNACSYEKDEMCCYTEENGLEKKIGFVNCSAVCYVETFLPRE